MARDLKNPEAEDLIDENYMLVQTPRRVLQAGRPDLEADDRPGSKFVAAVKDFAADGGFERMRRERDAEMEPVKGEKLPGPPVSTGVVERPREVDLDLEADKGDD